MNESTYSISLSILNECDAFGNVSLLRITKKKEIIESAVFRVSAEEEK